MLKHNGGARLPSLDSQTLASASRAHVRLFDEQAKLTAMHAGLETAVIGCQGRGPSLGKRVIDYSFQLPLQICWIVTALVGIVIVWLFFGGHTPAPGSP
jgi:hypothetical protein